MKKRICSLLLAIVMVIGLLPQTSHAADMVTVISTASELAALGGTALSGDYRLGANIDMTNVSMTPINSLRSGTFDGGGFAISNLSIEGSGNTGLFAELSSGGVITDLTLENCSVLNDSGSYTGTGMLVGQIVGQSEISRCGVVGGSVQSSASSAVYVGGLVGYASSPVAISGCYSTAAVTAGSSSGSRTGGLIGSTSGASSIDSCYARGAVDGGSGYAGGFAGYLYGSYSSKVEVSNSYAAATVTASSGKNYAFGYCYSNYALSACYYDETLTVDAKANTEDGVAAASTEVLKASAALLGSAFQDDPDSSTNDGYPMLKWQDPNATYTVSFSVTPANAVVSFDDEVQAAQPDGQYTFAGLAAGSTHSYLVEQADDTTDYAPQSGTITVGKADVQKAINLQANRYDLTFNVSPSDATLSVTDGENQLLVPEESTHTYSVTNGVYAYQAQAFGYEPLTGGSVTVEKAGATVDVTLNQQPVCTLSVRYGDLVDGAAIENGSLVIWTGEHTVAPKTDGGLVYELPVGYCYQYTFKSSNYEKVTGQVDLTASHEASAQDLTVPLSVKTAWGGADDIAEPQLVDGVYQITSGAELAWLAQQVNAGTGAGYQAALTKNIDLGSEAWTPIGLNYSKRFAGSFDGCGFTISGLHIDASVSGNYGLFGYVEGGTVQNLTVEGQITVTAGSSSYGVAGIVGQLNGAAGTIQNCISSVAVTGAQNVGGIVGYVASGYSTANKSIQSCANLGTVVSTGNNAGGIAGYVSGQVSIDSCYNRGNVTGGGWRAGGIAAYLSSSYATLQNCYTTGVISGSDANPVVGKKDSGTVDNLYYLASLGSDANAVAKTEGELKAASFPSVLGSQFVQDMAPPVNGGYPILTFQDTTPTYTATFTVAPADAVVTLTDLEGSNLTGTHSEQSGKAVWSFQLRSGEYRYQCTAFGKLADQGTLTIAQAAVSRSIVLEESPTKSVSLQLRYSDNNPGAVTPTVTVQCGERLVTAQEGV